MRVRLWERKNRHGEMARLTRWGDRYRAIDWAEDNRVDDTRCPQTILHLYKYNRWTTTAAVCHQSSEVHYKLIMKPWLLILVSATCALADVSDSVFHFGSLQGAGSQRSSRLHQRQTQDFQPEVQPRFQESSVFPSSPYPLIRILKQIQEVDPIGNYRFSFQTENGIDVQEQGEVIRPGRDDESISKEGAFSYTSPEGQPISVSWIADESGFRASGPHLPTPPPIPAEILRSLEVNAQEERNNRK